MKQYSFRQFSGLLILIDFQQEGIFAYLLIDYQNENAKKLTKSILLHQDNVKHYSEMKQIT